MDLSKSSSTRTLYELPEDEAVIDLTNSEIVLQFAHSIENLSNIRRQTIWIQNVQISETVQSQTTLRKQMHDILLFLIIIYGKEKFPEEEDLLISKLKIFVTSSAFTTFNEYIQDKYFPLIQDKFVQDHTYFASMVEDYACNELNPESIQRAVSLPLTLSHSSASYTLQSEDAFYARLEHKITSLFAERLSKIEYKMNNLSKEIQLMKYAMIEEAKLDDTEKVDDIIDEIQVIKHKIAKITRAQSEKTLSVDNNTKKKSERRTKRKKRRRKSTDDSMLISNGTNTNECDMETMVTEHVQSNEIERKKEELRTWLQNECGLSEYLDMFIKSGLDDLSMMPHITMKDLAWLGVNTLGHRVKIMQKVQQLKYEKQRM